MSAIDGGEDGLRLARECLAVAARHLDPGSPLLLQLRDEAQALTLGEGVGSLFDPVQTRTYDGRGAVLHLVRTGLAADQGTMVC